MRASPRSQQVAQNAQPLDDIIRAMGEMQFPGTPSMLPALGTLIRPSESRREPDYSTRRRGGGALGHYAAVGFLRKPNDEMLQPGAPAILSGLETDAPRRDAENVFEAMIKSGSRR